MKTSHLIIGLLLFHQIAQANEVGMIAEGMRHIRSGDSVEWATFPAQPSSTQFESSFESKANQATWTLSLRQQDVKQTWDVLLNEKRLGRLVRDENDLRTDFEVPSGLIVDGENQLVIRQTGNMETDDIRVGMIELHRMPPDRLRNLATIEVALVDDSDSPIPGRITIVEGARTLSPVGVISGDGLAVREGVIYTATGNASFGVRPGHYLIYGSRGMEYNAPWTRIKIGEGEKAKRTLQLQRVVDTGGWVACDTHVHTVTHSGHGDCTIEERMATLAGEGVELPIATDHNKHIDYRPVVKATGVERFFTPVIGNEVTTKQGHFNIFPVQAGAATPDHTQNDWQPLMDDIFATPDVQVAILNHARDIHGGFRPFSPRHHLSLTGENLDGWPQRFNAMELINSGAVQTDVMELFRDWCGLVNRGLSVTPVGSSDSHDVSRYIVGQGRTYIRCDDSDVGSIDVSEAVQAFCQGRVVVSYGLFTDMVVNDQARPGDLVTLGEEEDLILEVDVHGPPFVSAESLQVYVNGAMQFPQRVVSGIPLGQSSHKTRMVRRIARSELKHDVWLTAVARGPGVEAPFWRTAKPYQPDSPEFQSKVFSSTGPIWIDVDGDGRFSSPLEYAEQIVRQDQNPTQLVQRLNQYHPSVTHQAMALLRAHEVELEPYQEAAQGDVRQAIVDYRRAYRESLRASLERIE